MSCAQVTGESLASCSGDDDVDNDGLFGCDDSDCHRFQLCRISSPLVPDGGDPTPGGQGGNAGTRPPTGGSGGVGGVSSGGSGGNQENEDAGTEPDATVCDCKADETCSDTGCEPTVTPDPVYTVRMVSAESPRGLLGPPPDGTCVEIACSEGGGSPVSYCPCEPEPYVRVVLIRAAALDPTETNLLDTVVQGEQLTVMFSEDDKVDVELFPGDALRFELWDNNVVSADALVYSCEPGLNGLTPGPIACSVLSGALGLTEYSIRATLEYAQ